MRHCQKIHPEPPSILSADDQSVPQSSLDSAGLETSGDPSSYQSDCSSDWSSSYSSSRFSSNVLSSLSKSRSNTPASSANTLQLKFDSHAEKLISNVSPVNISEENALIDADQCLRAEMELDPPMNRMADARPPPREK